MLWWLIAGTRGGINRGKIIMALREQPRNANQLAELLSLDYKTVRHHLEVLRDNKIITAIGGKYGMIYFLSKDLEDDFAAFEEIWVRIGKK